MEEFNSQGKSKGGRSHKVIYDITYKGMKMLAMHCDPKTALYYLDLEELVFMFFDH